MADERTRTKTALLGFHDSGDRYIYTNIFRRKGYIVTDGEMKTSARGIYACGDARQKSLRQIITACGEGATAAFSAQHYVERAKGIEYK